MTPMCSGIDADIYGNIIYMYDQKQCAEREVLMIFSLYLGACSSYLAMWIGFWATINYYFHYLSIIMR